MKKKLQLPTLLSNVLFTIHMKPKHRFWTPCSTVWIVIRLKMTILSCSPFAWSMLWFIIQVQLHFLIFCSSLSSFSPLLESHSLTPSFHQKLILSPPFFPRCLFMEGADGKVISPFLLIVCDSIKSSTLSITFSLKFIFSSSFSIKVLMNNVFPNFYAQPNPLLERDPTVTNYLVASFKSCT